jgi:hypothetical protein
MKRSFTILDFPVKGQEFGRYISVYPSNAASKAFTQLSRIIGLKNTNDKNHMVFTIRETTQGLPPKSYTYIGTRLELVKPIIKQINGKVIKYRYKNIISRHPIK